MDAKFMKTPIHFIVDGKRIDVPIRETAILRGMTEHFFSEFVRVVKLMEFLQLIHREDVETFLTNEVPSLFYSFVSKSSEIIHASEDGVEAMIDVLEGVSDILCGMGEWIADPIIRDIYINGHKERIQMLRELSPIAEDLSDLFKDILGIHFKASDEKLMN
jgi:hypothetical protein